VGYHIYSSPLLRHTWIYAAGSVFVFWFSTSGETARNFHEIGYVRRACVLAICAARSRARAPPAPLLPGTMFNIIRGVPMVGYDPSTRKSVLFMGSE
jgi:hypothetical protein